MGPNDLEADSSCYEQLSIDQKRAVEWKAVVLLRKGSGGTNLLAIREELARSLNLDELVRIYKLDEKKNFQESFLLATQNIGTKELDLISPNSRLVLAPIISIQNA